MYNVLGKPLPLSLHAVSQWGGRESLPSQGFQLERGNDERVLDLPSIPQNLNPNYIKKTCTASAAGKIAPCRSYEQTGFTWKSWQGVEGSSDLNVWRRMVLSLSPAAGTDVGPLNVIFWKQQILASDYWMKMLVYLLQVYKYVYVSIPHLCKENFENINWWKLCKKKQFIYHCLFPPTVSLSWFLEKMDIWGPKFYKKTQVVDSLISVFPHGPSAWIHFQAKSPDNAECNISLLNPPVIIKNKQ